MKTLVEQRFLSMMTKTKNFRWQKSNNFRHDDKDENLVVFDNKTKTKTKIRLIDDDNN